MIVARRVCQSLNDIRVSPDTSAQMEVGVYVCAHHRLPIPPGTGFPLFPFPVSPLTPTVNTNCERGTRTATRLVGAIVDIQQCTPSKSHDAKMKQEETATSCPPMKSPLEWRFISGNKDPQTALRGCTRDISAKDVFFSL